MPAMLGLQALCFALAWRRYPGYDMTTHDISDLGQPKGNPEGWMFWSLGMGIAGLMMIPLCSYAIRTMDALHKSSPPGIQWKVRWGARLLRLAWVGMLGLALIPQYRGLDPAHQLAGVFAFGGLYVTMLFLWGRTWRAVPQVARWKVLVFHLSAWWGVVGFLGTQGYRFFRGDAADWHSVDGICRNPVFRFSLWEWNLFIALTTAFALFLLILPGPSAEIPRRTDGPRPS
jgi:hypothetical membrane protein